MPAAAHKLVKTGKSWALATYIVKMRKQRKKSKSVRATDYGHRDKTLKTRPPTRYT